MQNIVWFRSDLRTIDNPALSAALQDSKHNTRAVFYITEQQWLKHDWGVNKIGFVLHSVLELRNELASLNINLDIEYCPDFASLPQALATYLQRQQAVGLFYNHEYELNERLRDRAVEKLLVKQKIISKSYHAYALIEPGLILTKQKTPYTVFTPFKRACYEYLHANNFKLTTKPKAQASINQQAAQQNPIAEQYQHYLKAPVLQQWSYGQKHALKILDDFCSNDLKHYQQARDFPELNATSKLSPYLAIGSISVKQCFLAAIDHNDYEFASGNADIMCWISELLWRDFYKNIIWHFPELCKGKNFNSKYDQLAWLAPGSNLAKWQAGKTGVPIIDAAMRQLVATGWMHNRLRMIVAMFLTKNLLIDWRHGEKFFGQHLVDIDFASNNGGWQWSASTGTDAVPYFRIFNPITQSGRFDPQGLFIKRYCPELASLSAKQIHDPSAYLTAAELEKINYPKLIVDIGKSRLRALEAFKSGS